MLVLARGLVKMTMVVCHNRMENFAVITNCARRVFENYILGYFLVIC